MKVVHSWYRQGIAGHLLRACEAVGAAAGFWTFYIQADTEQHNHSTFLPFDTTEYSAAVDAYKKAGYQEYAPRSGWKQVSFWSQSAKLMYKTFRPWLVVYAICNSSLVLVHVLTVYIQQCDIDWKNRLKTYAAQAISSIRPGSSALYAD